MVTAIAKDLYDDIIYFSTRSNTSTFDVYKYSTNDISGSLEKINTSNLEGWDYSISSDNKLYGAGGKSYFTINLTNNSSSTYNTNNSIHAYGGVINTNSNKYYMHGSYDSPNNELYVVDTSTGDITNTITVGAGQNGNFLWGGLGLVGDSTTSTLNISLNITDSPTHANITAIELIDLEAEDNETNSTLTTDAKFYKETGIGSNKLYAIKLYSNSKEWLYNDTNISVFDEVSFDYSNSFKSTYGFTFSETTPSKDLNLSSLRFTDVLGVFLNTIEEPTEITVTDIELINLEVESNQTLSFATNMKFCKNFDGNDKLYAIKLYADDATEWLYNDSNITSFEKVSFDYSDSFKTIYGFTFNKTIYAKDLNLSSLRFVDDSEELEGDFNQVGDDPLLTSPHSLSLNHSYVSIDRESEKPYFIYKRTSSPEISVSSYDGSSWSDYGNSGFSNGGGSYPFIAVNQNQIPYVIYMDGANPNTAVYDKCTVKKFDGSNWVSLGDEQYSSQSCYMGRLAFKSDGNPVSFNALGSNGDIWEFDGTNWSQIDTSGLDISIDGINNAGAVASNGDIYWAHRDSSAKVRVEVYDGNSWTTLGGDSIPSNIIKQRIDMVLDSNNIPYVVFKDEVDDAVVVYKFSNNSWSKVGAVDVDTLLDDEFANAKIDVDSYGNLYVTYLNSNSNFTVKMFNGISWKLIGSDFVTDKSSSQSINYPTLNVADSGNIYIGYWKSSNNAGLVKYEKSTSDLNLSLNIIDIPTHTTIKSIELIDLNLDDNETNSSFITEAKFFKSVTNGGYKSYAIKIYANDGTEWLYNDSNITSFEKVSFDYSDSFKTIYGFAFRETHFSKDLNLSSLRFKFGTCESTGIGCPNCIGSQTLNYNSDGSGFCTNPSCLDSEKIVNGECIAKTCAIDNYNCPPEKETNGVTYPDKDYEEKKDEDNETTITGLFNNDKKETNTTVTSANKSNDDNFDKGKDVEITVSSKDKDSGDEDETKFKSNYKDLKIKLGNDGSVTASYNSKNRDENGDTSKIEYRVHIKASGKVEGQVSINRSSIGIINRSFFLPASSSSEIKEDGSFEATMMYVQEQDIDGEMDYSISNSYNDSSRFQVVLEVFPNGKLESKVVDLKNLTQIKGSKFNSLLSANYSAKEEFFDVNVDIKLGEDNSLTALFETGSYFSYSNYSLNRDFKYPKSVEIIPMSQWQRFEEMDNFDGTRSIKLLLGLADIIIDGQRESMQKEKIYYLPEFEKRPVEIDLDLNLTSPIYENKELKLLQGWNLISNPINQELNSSILNSSIIFSYQNRNWIQNPDILYPKLGYWVKSDENQSIEIDGDSYSLDINGSKLTNEWSLIGFGENIVNLKDKFNLETIYTNYNGVWSENPENIYRGEGVWIK